MKTFKTYSTVSGILLTILLIAGADAYKNFLDLAEVNRLETNKHITLKRIEIVLGKVTDAETGQRGYIITGNEDYLRPYHAAVATIDKDIKELRFMTKDNAGHQRMLDTLETLIIEKLSGLANRINLRKTKGFDAAAREVRIGKGKDIMDKIRKNTDGMEEDIRKSIEQKRKEIESQSKHTAFYILFGSSLALLIVIISSFITRRELIARNRAEEELKKYAEHLEVAVSERTNELTKTNKQLEMEISEHSKTGENLKESELWYRSLFKYSPISLWEEDFSDVKKYIDSLCSIGISDFRTYFQDHPEDVINCATMVKVVDVNEVTLKMYQAGSVEDLRRGLDSVFTEESYEVFKEALIALAEGKLRYESEAVNRTLGGRKLDILIMWTVPPGYEATWSKGLVSIIDITERKQVEIALLESEKKYRNLVENTLVGIYKTNLKGNLLYVNKALSRMLDFESPEDMIAETAFMRYKNLKDREILVEKLKEINRVESFEVELLTKKGKIKHAILSACLDNDTVSGMVMDITERKRVEEQLRILSEQLRNLAAHLQTSREEERIAIAHDIHDELGQKLSGLKFELMYLQNILSGNEEKDRFILKKIQSISVLIDSLIQWSRNLMTRLRPSILDDMGIEAALEWQIKEFQNRLHIPCTFNSSLKDIRLHDEPSIALFRICQECLTNISRHADATAVAVNLKESEDKIMLEVSDNGIGITDNQINNYRSFGVIGMRERAIMLDGEFIIMGEEGKGTTVTVTIPKSSMDMK